MVPSIFLQRFLLLFLLFSIHLSSQSLHSEAESRRILDSLTHCSFFDTASVSVSVFNPVTGKSLYGYNENKLFHPASNMKIFTSAAALVYLGPDYSFNTNVFADNVTSSGVLQGLWIKGCGDPDFSVADIDSLIRQLQLAGIKKIEGQITGDVSLLDTVIWGNGWMWDDASSTDAPFMTPLIINKNAVTIRTYVKEGKVVSELDPYASYLKVWQDIAIDSLHNSRLQFENGYPASSELLKVYGRINPRDTVSETINVLEPARYFLELFKERCKAAGIEVAGGVSFGKVPEKLSIIASIARPLSEVLIDLNKQSRNLSAEIAMRLLAITHKKEGIRDYDGLKMIDSLIVAAGLHPEDYRIADGSGLSRYNLVSSKLISSVLTYLFYQKPEAYSILRDVFPSMGMDGTLRKRMKSTALQGNVYAKTGTLSGVSCLSGYIHTSSGSPLIFSIMMQHHNGKLNRCLQIQHEILGELMNNE
ncbi:MAG: D-alanyl-D-alanine carboxypeptidase/D-alanyl-D-alanine-endopeptidase [Ignavibacteriales bacterium]|nr:D-alanyl-D-alanine carboxypeptidase/D-alanyl-D-alanine-endopeptidase [Ignavibacteriales bacterium]